jgi:hypothetical protein
MANEEHVAILKQGVRVWNEWRQNNRDIRPVLTRAVLTGANLADAALYDTHLANLNLNSVIGLETCRHNGPSPIDFRTLAQSWPLPLGFLRGVGLPDNWFAPEDLKIGDKFRVKIDESIRIYEKLLLILSEHSLRSDWVEKEVETALEKEREQKRTILFPVRLDNSVFESRAGWAADIRRTRHVGDFRRWKDHDAYQKTFERLLRDLKAADEKPQKNQA